MNYGIPDSSKTGKYPSSSILIVLLFRLIHFNHSVTYPLLTVALVYSFKIRTKYLRFPKFLILFFSPIFFSLLALSILQNHRRCTHTHTHGDSKWERERERERKPWRSRRLRASHSLREQKGTRSMTIT